MPKPPHGILAGFGVHQYLIAGYLHRKLESNVLILPPKFYHCLLSYHVFLSMTLVQLLCMLPSYMLNLSHTRAARTHAHTHTSLFISTLPLGLSISSIWLQHPILVLAGSLSLLSSYSRTSSSQILSAPLPSFLIQEGLAGENVISSGQLWEAP